MDGECRRQLRGHGDLVRTARIAAGDECEHRSAVRAVGVLRAQLRTLREAGREVGVLDDIGRTEVLLYGGDVRRETWIGAGDRDEVVGGAEAGVGGRGRIAGDGGAQDGRGDRDDDERQHQQLLAPLPPEQAPGPAHDGPACRCASAAGGGRAIEDSGTHECGLGCGAASSRDSGLGGGDV
jgi:hypothetical protein